MEDRKILTQVYEILKLLSDDEFNKIPIEIIKMIEENKDNNYIWKYNDTIPLKNQNIDRGTVAVLSYININYLLDTEQRKNIEDIILYNEKKAESLKREKYDPNQMFNKYKLNNSNAEININADLAITKTKKDNIIIKILNKIKRFLQKT